MTVATLGRLAFSLFLFGLVFDWTSIPSTTAAEVASVKESRLSSARDLNGKNRSLVPERGRFQIVVFYSTECPISNAYSSTYNSLGKLYEGKASLLGVCVDPDIGPEEVRSHARDFELDFPLIQDRSGRLARRLGATKTPEAFVIDDKGEIRYHGRIDDQFSSRQVRAANPTGSQLKDALTQLLAAKEVAAPFVEPVGCPIPEVAVKETVPTYAKDVAPILFKNCLECHRKGQVGPFSLETYEQAQKRAIDLANVVTDHLMPPWKPIHGVGGPFKDDRSLSEIEIATIVAWAEGNAPEGDRADLPAMPTFNDGWRLGTPDLIVDIGDDMEIPATGEDIYRCFVRPTSLPKDTYLSAIEYEPGNRRVVHHILAYVDTSGEARKKDAADPGPGYMCFSGPEVEVHGDLGGWAPGNLPSVLPDGIGRSLPKGGDVIIQVHYHPTGKPEKDRTRIGLYFSKKPVKQTIAWGVAANRKDLVLQPSTTKTIRGEWVVPVDTVAYAVTPHMHLLGKKISMAIKFPDGHSRDLIKIDDWDFNWQGTYYFKKPFDVPKGSVVSVTSMFDNTSGNPRNPNSPPQEVRWGEATTDEMCIGFIAMTKKNQDLTRPGEVDDLHDIFSKDVRERIEKRQKAEREKKQAKQK